MFTSDRAADPLPWLRFLLLPSSFLLPAFPAKSLYADPYPLYAVFSSIVTGHALATIPIARITASMAHTPDPTTNP